MSSAESLAIGLVLGLDWPMEPRLGSVMELRSAPGSETCSAVLREALKGSVTAFGSAVRFDSHSCAHSTTESQRWCSNRILQHVDTRRSRQHT